ncbi:chemotaxis protein methyltransferase [Thalassotalea loyana]|uniref:Chemotaxis protein methyltransferase n=1 Tax=Thalassotalea loyana TaxID=280483 RepID=A0ABQ6HIR2_9GAMM|nr:protein-glutamate O-methyltransferase CheR [Thalassotalea loyana]GLX86541.1 chemotaxis protein methyltransferase [Thalassotalea loyana]
MMSNQVTVERLNNKQFEFLCQFIYDETGIVLTPTKVEMVHRRLSKLTKAKNFSSLEDYYQHFVTHQEEEKKDLVNALTTNLTRFFRENHHFDYLKDHFLPYLFERNSDTKRIRIWSSACSTGEEPYSLAMLLVQHFRTYIDSWDVKILATDIDTEVLNTAKEGIYSKLAMDDIPLEMRSKSVNLCGASQIEIKPNVRDLITFKNLNLLHEWPMKGPFDVIFCRNVIIYFDKATQQALFHRFHNYLSDGSILVLGHSESLGKSAGLYKNQGKTIFSKSKAD